MYGLVLALVYIFGLISPVLIVAIFYAAALGSPTVTTRYVRAFCTDLATGRG